MPPDRALHPNDILTSGHECVPERVLSPCERSVPRQREPSRLLLLGFMAGRFRSAQPGLVPPGQRSRVRHPRAVKVPTRKRVRPETALAREVARVRPGGRPATGKRVAAGLEKRTHQKTVHIKYSANALHCRSGRAPNRFW